MSNGSFSDTPTVLRWAADAAKDDPVVEMFWRKLCDAINEPVDATPERILSELCAYVETSGAKRGLPSCAYAGELLTEELNAVGYRPS